MEIAEFIKLIDKTLTDILKSYTLPNQPGVAFSGGIDSTTIAFKLKKLGFKPILLTAGSSRSKEKPYAKQIAKRLELEFIFVEISPEFINNNLDLIYNVLKQKTPQKISQLAYKTRPRFPGLETYPNAMDVTIGLCMYAIAKHPKAPKTILTGHGAGDLFLGAYKVYKLSRDQLQDYIVNQALPSGKVDIFRDPLIAEQAGKTLLNPLLEEEFVKMALQIPVSLKLKDNIRKYIWLKYAEWLGVPKMAIQRRPKAMQYGCGFLKQVQKILKIKAAENTKIKNHPKKERLRKLPTTKTIPTASSE